MPTTTTKGTLQYSNDTKYDGDILVIESTLPLALRLLTNCTAIINLGQDNLQEAENQKMYYRHGSGSLLVPSTLEKFVGTFLHDEFTFGTYTRGKFETYTGEFSNGSFNCAGSHVCRGVKYVGEFKDGLRHGNGTLEDVDGRVYSGSFKFGQQHGYGTETNGTGTKFEGNFYRGLQSGHGKLSLASGATFEGPFRNGSRAFGDWLIRFANGDSYQGASSDGVNPHGKGTIKTREGDVFNGEFCNGLKHGAGLIIFASGEEWKGEFLHGQPVGLCDWAADDGHLSDITLNLNSNSNSYSNSYSNSNSNLEEKEKVAKVKPNLQRSSSEYIGGLDSDNLRHGMGTYSSAKIGIKQDGEYEHGKFVRGFFSVLNTLTYTGEFDEMGEFHGEGEVSSKSATDIMATSTTELTLLQLVDCSGVCYVGGFKHGVKEGCGRCVDASNEGTVFVGEFKNGQQNGVGTLSKIVEEDSGKFIYSGGWKEGRMDGEGKLWRNNEMYSGCWRGGLMDGIFNIEGEDKNEECEFKLGERVLVGGADVRIEWKDEDGRINATFNGDWNGLGIHKGVGNDVYNGEFVLGKRCGQGQCIFANGEVFKGFWIRDRIDTTREGMLTLADGTVHEY